MSGDSLEAYWSIVRHDFVEFRIRHRGFEVYIRPVFLFPALRSVSGLDDPRSFEKFQKEERLQRLLEFSSAA